MSDGIRLARRAAIVVNPAKIDRAAVHRAVAGEEARLGWLPSTWFDTDAEDEGMRAVAAAAASEPDLVVVAGGDGTLRAVAAVLAGSGIPVGIVPVGTANNFARELGLPVNDLPAAVRTAFAGTDSPTDLARAVRHRADGSAEPGMYLVMAGVGVDARMAADVSARLKRRVGWLAYVDPIARSILRNAHIDLTYRLDDAPEVSARAHTFIVGNSGALPGGLRLIPRARIDDGLLDMVLLRPGRGAGWLRIALWVARNSTPRRMRRRQGAVRPAPGVVAVGQSASVRVRFASPQLLQFDGDPQGLVTGVDVGVQPGALLIRVPHALPS